MKSKIGKLGKIGDVSESAEYKFLTRVINDIIEKQGEIIDHLNSQDQEEDECECCKWDDMGYTHEPDCPLFKEYWKDTPEEWDMNSNCDFNYVKGWNDCLEKTKQLLEEREYKAREEGLQEVYKKFCEWEMPRNLSKKQKETFDDLLGELYKLTEDK